MQETVPTPRSLSFQTDNDLLPLYPPDPDLPETLAEALRIRLTPFHPALALTLDLREREKVQTFTVRFGGDAGMRSAVIVFDILARHIAFPADDPLFALAAMEVFGGQLFRRPFSPDRIYRLDRMPSWCLEPAHRTASMTRIALCGFRASLPHPVRSVSVQETDAAVERYRRLAEEYPEVMVTMLEFEVRFEDGAVRHYRVEEHELCAFRRDARIGEFERFLAARNGVEFPDANSRTDG